ncbi:MAG: tobe domain protein [Flavobacteriaceae bacterium]|nr:MAG: tobe domain protein [Flavobacteriaceae bacterium]
MDTLSKIYTRMNKIKGEIIAIKSSGSVSIVKINVNNHIISSILLENKGDSFIKIAAHVSVLFKETAVVIAKGTVANISLQNKFSGPIISLEKGAILSILTIHTALGNISSMITTNAVEQLKLSLNDTVTAMIKSNEIMLAV